MKTPRRIPVVIVPAELLLRAAVLLARKKSSEEERFWVIEKLLPLLRGNFTIKHKWKE